MSSNKSMKAHKNDNNIMKVSYGQNTISEYNEIKKNQEGKKDSIGNNQSNIQINQKRNQLIDGKVKELEEVLKQKDKEITKLKNLNQKYTREMKSLGEQIDENLEKVIHLPKEESKEEFLSNYRTSKQMTIDLLQQDILIKQKEIQYLKRRIRTNIQPQKQFELQNAIKESECQNELLSKEIKHLHKTTKDTASTLIKSTLTKEEINNFESKIRFLEEEHLFELEKSGDLNNKFESCEELFSKKSTLIEKKKSEVDQINKDIEIADFKLKQKMKNYATILPNNEDDETYTKDILNEKNSQIYKINNLKKDVEKEFNEKLNELNEFKNKFEKIDKINNTNLHKINEILNIMKNNKNVEKRKAVREAEEITFPPINHYPRRLYLKKKQINRANFANNTVDDEEFDEMDLFKGAKLNNVKPLKASNIHLKNHEPDFYQKARIQK